MSRVARLFKALWLFIPGVIAVGAIYYLLTGVEQGIDVVIQSGELLDSGVLSMLAVFLWAFLVWYSSRTLSYIKQHKDDELFSKKSRDDITSARLYKKYCIPARLYRHIPRLLAYNCFVSIQLAIFRLPTFFDWPGWVMFLAFLAHNLFYFSLDIWLQSVAGTGKRKYLGYVNRLIIGGYCTFIVYHIMENARGMDLIHDPLRHMFWLSLMALIMFILQILAVFLFILRRKDIDARRRNPGLRQSKLLHLIGFNPAFNAAETPYFNLLNGSAAVAAVIYSMGIFVMPFAALMGPLAFTLLALGVLTGIFNLVTVASIRSSFNVVIILMAIAILLGQFRDPYPVRFLESDSRVSFGTRPDTKTYLRKWFGQRIKKIDLADSTRNFPVYLVLSNGGASRAGKWTSSVLSHLQDTSYQLDPRDSFKDHILCLAGASGGSVGNGAFYSLLKASREEKIRPDEFRKHADTFFEADFLTYTLARLLGPDIFRHLIPFNIPLHNRADALENAIAKSSADTLINGYFELPVSQVFDTTGALPILFINTTQVDNGMPGVISTVRLPDRSQRQDVLSLVDSMGMHHGTGDLRLSTAAVLSSRFPYVSPAGKVFDRYYVDGGYFDNSGAGTVLEFISALNSFMTDTAQKEMLRYRKHFTFHILHITNSEVIPRPSNDIHPLTNDLLAPVLTLAGMQGSSTNIGNGMLIQAFRQFNVDTANALIVYNLYDEMWPDSLLRRGQFEDGYPMSWVLSDYQLDRMKDALTRANKTNLEKFRFGNDIAN